MSQPSPAAGPAAAPGHGAPPPGAARPRRPGGAKLALVNWRVSWRLFALIVVPTAMGLVFAGLQVSVAVRNAQTMGQVERLAAAGQQITGLAQAMDDERDQTAGIIARAQPSGAAAQLQRQYAVTDRWAARVRLLIRQLGTGYPAQTLADARAVLASIAGLPQLRREAAGGSVPALTVISDYTSAAASLYSFNDGIAQQSGNFAFANSVRALAALSRMKDQASQQRAILYTALIAGQFTPDEQTALIAAQAQQASDLALFQASATAPESQLLARTVAGPLLNQAQGLEQLIVADTSNGTALAFGKNASHAWYADMSYTIGRMRQVEQDLAGSVAGNAQALQRGAEATTAETGGGALAALLIVLLITVLIARSMVRPLRRLRQGALDIAETRLPAEIRELSRTPDAGQPLDVQPIDVLSTDEIGQVARAFDQVHREAVRLAGEESRLQTNMSAMFVSLSRRSQSLLERLLRMIENLELGEEDPERLSHLFRIDHLATRMRRNSENLLVLAGHETSRRWAEPVPLVDVLRAALSEIEQYDRVALNVHPGVAINGAGVADTVHMFAELLENATTFSAKTTQVIVSGHAVSSGGAQVGISDSGMGMPAEQLARLNERLANPPAADVEVSRHMGLFAVAHLAARHQVTVQLTLAPGGGTTAQVLIPASLTARDKRDSPWQRRAETGPQPAALPSVRGSRYSPPLAAARASAAAALAAPPAVAGPALAAPTLAGPAAAVPAGGDVARGDALPIFDSIESEWFRARGRRVMPPGGPRTPKTAPSPGSWRSPGDEGWRAAAAIASPSVGGMTSAGLPRRVPRANLVPGSAGGPHTKMATIAESAQVARDRLANFQRGSRRARAGQASPGTAAQ